MNAKVYLNNEIHRISKLPASLEALIETISSFFKDQLPHFWTLYSIDVQGKQIDISNEQDYLKLLETESVVQSPLIKLYVVPNISHGTFENNTSAHAQNIFKPNPEEKPHLVENTLGEPMVEEIISSSQKIVQEDKNYADDTQMIQNVQYIQGDLRRLPEDFVPEVMTTEEIQELQATRVFSQDNREKLVETNQRVDRDSRFYEVHPRARPQPNNEGCTRRKMMKVKHLFRKLAKGKLPEAKVTELTEKLKKLEASLTPSQREEFERKKEKAMARFADKHSKKNKRCLKHLKDDNDYGMMHKFMVSEESQTMINNTEGESQIQAQAEGRTVHHFAGCDGCGVTPIVGIRYKCSECTQFDFCEKCEATKEHPHPFLKLRQPLSEGFARMRFETRNPDCTLKRHKYMFKSFKVYKKMLKASMKGKTDKANKLYEELVTDFPEQAKLLLNSGGEQYAQEIGNMLQEWKKTKHHSRRFKHHHHDHDHHDHQHHHRRHWKREKEERRGEKEEREKMFNRKEKSVSQELSELCEFMDTTLSKVALDQLSSGKEQSQ